MDCLELEIRFPSWERDLAPLRDLLATDYCSNGGPRLWNFILPAEYPNDTASLAALGPLLEELTLADQPARSEAKNRN